MTQIQIDWTRRGPDLRPSDAADEETLVGRVLKHVQRQPSVTLEDLELLTGRSNATVSARVRDVRAWARQRGGDVKRERIAGTRLFLYRLVLP